METLPDCALVLRVCAALVFDKNRGAPVTDKTRSKSKFRCGLLARREKPGRWYLHTDFADESDEEFGKDESFHNFASQF